MTRIRNLLFFVLAMAFTAFALPASAQTKQYSLNISTDGTTAGSLANVDIPAGGKKVYWTIGNQTPSGGNSAIGSWVIKQAPGYKISGPYTGPAGAVFDDQTQPGNLKVSGIGPLVPKSNQTGQHYATITFTLTPADPCASAQVTWAPNNVVVTTGTFSNTTFTFVGPTFTDYTGTAQSTTQTTTSAAGTCYNVTGVADPSAGGTVACNPSKVLSGGTSTCTSTAAATYFPTGFSGSPINCVQIGTTNQCTVTNVTSDTTTTGYFAKSTGTVGCISTDDPNTAANDINNYASSAAAGDFSYDPDKSNVPFYAGWGLRRGNNYAGQPCTKNVDIAFTPPTTTTSVASVLFDRTVGESASFKYLIVWPKSVAMDSTGWTNFRPSVSWGIPNPTAATDFVPGVFCADEVASVDITTLDATALQALLPNMPDDSSTNGPFYQASQAHPDVYPLGGKAKVCVARSGVLSDGGVLFPFAEFLDEADSYIKF